MLIFGPSLFSFERFNVFKSKLNDSFQIKLMKVIFDLTISITTLLITFLQEANFAITSTMLGFSFVLNIFKDFERGSLQQCSGHLMTLCGGL